jgi:uncharacterized protein Usg
MSQWILIGANFASIVLLTFGLYVPRHRRRDMVVAYLGINTGVLAICGVLTSVSASVGLGIGLFGVLSIIRLRSDELNQREVAYYFASLAFGLLGGTQVDSWRLSVVLMGIMLVTMYIGDHPSLLRHYRTRELNLDRAFVDEQQLADYLAELLGARIHRVNVRRVDLVNDTTQVEVRYQVREVAPEPDYPIADNVSLRSLVQ